MNKTIKNSDCIIVTAGSAYLDIDAYACCVAMKELLLLLGQNAIAYSCASYNYSVCESLVEVGQIESTLPSDYKKEDLKYIIVDVSDPEYIKDSVPLDSVIEVYDHHVGFEEYWNNRIGDGSNIEFIGAAATLIFQQWKRAGLQGRMTRPTALLLIAAILDNTLNLTSSNTARVDIEAFEELCRIAQVDEEWCAAYFSEVQSNVEADLKNALFNDIKRIDNNDVLPRRVAQLCVWDAQRIIEKLNQIRQWFGDEQSFMINIIDIKRRCSYFVCDDEYHQNQIARVFDVSFEAGVAKTSISYLRKEIIKKAYY